MESRLGVGLLAAALAWVPVALALEIPPGAADRDDGAEFAECVRIFRALDERGREAIVLTNLDERGRRRTECLAAAETGPARRGQRPAGEPPRPTAGDSAASGEVEVELTGAPLPEGSEIEVRTGDGGGTTIVININPPPTAPPPPPQPAAPLLLVPAIGYAAIGGVPGPIRYPDDPPFLGYGFDTGSPSWFGGLALNAGNNFGLTVGRPCGPGFDCMFGPRPDDP